MQQEVIGASGNHCNGDSLTKLNAFNNRPCYRLSRPIRDDSCFEENIFPETTEGRLLYGILRSFLIKQEPRLGWARKGACDEKILLRHPCEVVASHQWGVQWLVMTLSKTEEFKNEMPNFDSIRAYEMASQHDLAELVIGDITPVDGVNIDEKHRRESKAMQSIISCYPKRVAEELHDIYARYENRQCIESKFVKDCDRLDFMITAFLLERQGFEGFYEFYGNTNKNFSTRLATNIAKTLIETRNKLLGQPE